MNQIEEFDKNKKSKLKSELRERFGLFVKRSKQIIATFIIMLLCAVILYAPYWLACPETFWQRLVSIVLIVMFIAWWVVPFAVFLIIIAIAGIEDGEWYI